jgi:hypothetical protein
MALQLALFVVFLICGLVYGRASKELQRLNQLRLDKESPPPPTTAAEAAASFARKLSLKLSPGGEELKLFCERNGHAETFSRASRWLYASIMVALVCAYLILRIAAAEVAPK